MSREIPTLKRYRFAEKSLMVAKLTVSRTGYTGEDGVELVMGSTVARFVLPMLLREKEGVAAAVRPAGLGARDTLRLEAALPLHGHELGPGITSLQAGLGWVVAWDKGEFRGRATLAAERERGPHRVLRGIATEGRRPPRADCSVLVDGEPVGVVTSGNYSPVLEHGIALAFLRPDVAVGADVAVDVRGSLLAGCVVPTPFVAKR
jgi:aminomethyltransferase